MAPIAGHVWRPMHPTSLRLKVMPKRQLPCAYMGCGRSRAEHARSVSAGAR